MSTRRMLVFVFLVLALAGLLSACAAPAAAPADEGQAATDQAVGQAAPATEQKTDFYFVYVPKLVHPWYEDVKAGADRAVAELAQRGINVKYDDSEEAGRAVCVVPGRGSGQAVDRRGGGAGGAGDRV